MLPTAPRADGLGRQTLATARTACGKDLAAVFGAETGAKAVAAFTHKFTGLIGAFHSAYSGLVLCPVKTECLEGEMKCQNDKNDRRTRSILLTLITRKNDRGLMKDRREKVNAPDGFLWAEIGYPGPEAFVVSRKGSKHSVRARCGQWLHPTDRRSTAHGYCAPL